MSLIIKLQNRLDPSQEKSFYAINSDSVYQKIAEELKCKSHVILVYSGDEILEREVKFQKLEENSDLFLSYVNGNQIYKKFESIYLSPKFEKKNSNQIQYSTSFVESQEFPSYKSGIQQDEQILLFQREKYIEKIEKIDEILQRKLQKSQQFLNESNDLLQSQMIEQINICRYCYLPIEQCTFQTPCQHSFHTQCLESVVDTQIQINNPKLQCLCNKEIKLKLLFNLISNQIEANMKLTYFLQNQLKSIKEVKTNKAMNCQQKCGFFYFNIQQITEETSFCSICNKITFFTSK